MPRKLLLPWIAFVTILFAGASHGSTHHHLDWTIEYTNVTRLCNTKSLVSVNGQFPGPTVYVKEGDSVTVNITNLVSYNVTIHWHGVRQLLSAWADGPAYITQCPIQAGASFVHNFQVIEQTGTLFWHAHISWLRATLYGAFIIQPNDNAPYPFPTPAGEIPILLGEWWIANVEDVIEEALESGRGYNHSDAITINGQPGALYNCSQDGMPIFNVSRGNTYLLRIVNAALNTQLFFAVANHTLTVVGADAEYTQPLTTDVAVLAPGQTTDLLLTADQPIGQYYIAASAFSPPPRENLSYPETPTTAILNYIGATAASSSNLTLPSLPAVNDTAYVANFTHSLKAYYQSDVPTEIDEDLLFTLSYAMQPFDSAPYTTLITAINNVTFKDPTISLLQAYYYQISGVYETDFPDNPPFPFDFTGGDPSDLSMSVLGTKVKVLDFNTSVQIVFQGTNTLFAESHPVHLHGQNFYIVGSDFGNYNSTSDPANFNLQDPPSRNTIAVPSGGWAAVRFTATNPGVWYLHCHIESHTSWGMSMAFIVKDGSGISQTLPAPPTDLPPC